MKNVRYVPRILQTAREISLPNFLVQYFFRGLPIWHSLNNQFRAGHIFPPVSLSKQFKKPTNRMFYIHPSTDYPHCSADRLLFFRYIRWEFDISLSPFSTFSTGTPFIYFHLRSTIPITISISINMKMFSFFLVGALLSMLVISTSARVVPSDEAQKIDPELLSAVSRPMKADLATVARKLSSAGKTKNWVCWDCWAAGYCCPNHCPQNC